MRILAVDEYNDNGHLIYSTNYIGAYVRGKTRADALNKFEKEIISYAKWLGIQVDTESCIIELIQEKLSELQICDADSDIIFDDECKPITREKYELLKMLAMKSAYDFLFMYNSIDNKNETTLTRRKTFYGDVPVTAEEMYQHTKSVNSYYFHEIGIAASNEPDIASCRQMAFLSLEKRENYLDNEVFCGSYGEKWSLAKLCRRFVWHDRIHAKAMYKMATTLCGIENVENPFCF